MYLIYNFFENMKHLISEGAETSDATFDPLAVIAKQNLSIRFRDKRRSENGLLVTGDLNPSNEIGRVASGR